MTIKLPEWPTKEAFTTYSDEDNGANEWTLDEAAYHKARADYWEARARMAVPHVRHAMSCDCQLAGCIPEPYDRCTCGAVEALALIGPLPTDETTPPPRRDV